MKSFFKIVIGSALGFIIANIIIVILSISAIFILAFGIIDNDRTVFKKTNLEKSNVLVIDLSNSIQDTQDRNPNFETISNIIGNSGDNMGLNDIVAALRIAKKNDKIKAVYLKGGTPIASPAILKELRDELEIFKKTGKPIISYSNNYSQTGYYIASVSNKILLNPEGSLELKGLSVNPIFYKDALDKIGIDVQVFKVGTFKSAVEPYIQNGMSEANREQLNLVLGDIWDCLKKDISKSRNISEENIDKIANQFTLFQDSTFFLKEKLVDKIIYETKIKDYLKKELKISDELNFVNIKDLKSRKQVSKSENSIAVLYASGSISQGNNSSDIQDKYFINEIEKLRKDNKIKAVVFRVNSPGGSAYASEQIWEAISNLKAEKPVVVSMGDYAASGGYYISCNASKIVAQPTTITGSIGIFAMIPNFKNLTNKIGISREVVKTNKFSDFPDISRPFNNEESEIIQESINRGYNLFLTRCAEGRNMPKDSIEKYAEGRIWSGERAKQIGLIDEIGGIDKAIDIAAELAHLGKNYQVFEYTKSKTFLENLLNINKDNFIFSKLKEYLGESADLFLFMKNKQNLDCLQTRTPYDLNIR